jgi:hypothetical protein
MSTDRYDQYRLNAEEAERQAKNSKNDTDRAAWLRLVRDWLALLPKREQTATETFDSAETEHGTAQQNSDETH